MLERKAKRAGFLAKGRLAAGWRPGRVLVLVVMADEFAGSRGPVSGQSLNPGKRKVRARGVLRGMPGWDESAKEKNENGKQADGIARAARKAQPAGNAARALAPSHPVPINAHNAY